MSDDAKTQRKALIRKIEIVVLLVLFPILAWYGRAAWVAYRAVVQSEQLFIAAEARMERRDWKGAMQMLEECVAVNPVYFPAYEAMAAIVWDEYKDRKVLVGILDRAVLNSPDDARSHRLYGHYCVTVLKDYKRAQQELQVAVRQAPGDLLAQKLLERADAEVAAKRL